MKAIDRYKIVESNNFWNRPFKKFIDRFLCPCCNYPTLGERYMWEICGLCDWEDDGQDDADADKVFGGPNRDYSLTEARNNFRTYLTMYRPSDKVPFKRHDRKRIEEIKKTYDNVLDSEMADIDTIKKELRIAEKLQDKLLRAKLKS